MTNSEYSFVLPVEQKIQYGVQVVWADPVKSGAVTLAEQMDRDFIYSPRWFVFDSEAEADTFAETYQCRLGQMAQRMPWMAKYEDFDPDEVWTAHGVTTINRARRWAVEMYGEWES